MASRRKEKDIVILTALNSAKDVVEEVRMQIDEYYENSGDLIDSSGYRKKHRVRIVCGKIYDTRGRISQSFENEYDSDGNLIHNRTTHNDGTVTEFKG